MMFSRRDFLSLAGAGAAGMFRHETLTAANNSIDRRNLVRRHNPVVTAAILLSALYRQR